MKKVLVVCGNGIASSSIMVASLQDYLKEQNVEAQIDKASLIDLSGSVGAERINGYDLLVSSIPCIKRCTFNVKKYREYLQIQKSRTFASAIRDVAQPG